MIPDGRLLLLRHGEADGRGRAYGQLLDPPLTGAGRRQAAAAAARLRLGAGVGIAELDHVVRSPTVRTAATTAAISHRADVDARWAERHLGEWEGHPWEQLWEQAPAEVLRDPVAYAAFTPPGAETAGDVVARVGGALDELLARPGTTLVVTHAGPIRAVLARVLDVALPTTFALAVEPGRLAVVARYGPDLVLERLGA